LDARAKALIEKELPKSKKQKAKDHLNLEAIPHPQLYALLRSWRYEKASELGIPAYMIFSQKALIELVNFLPTHLKTLKQINGLGNKKIEQFGEDIVQMIQHYCQENTIKKDEIPFKEAIEKPKKIKVDTKKVSFEMFKSGKSIAEIAEERGFNAATIEGHLAHFISRGELDAKQVLSEEKLNKLIEYFKSTENQGLSFAKEKLGDEMTYGELKIGLSYLEFLKKNL
jgi:ribonuclease D